MKLRDILLLVFHNLNRMRTRVIMTGLGVVIGTAAVMVLISLGAGLARRTQESLMSGGGLTDMQIVAPIDFQERHDTLPGEGLLLDEDNSAISRKLKQAILDGWMLDEIRELPEVEDVFVSETLMAQAKIYYEKLEGYPSIVGIESDTLTKMGIHLSSGTMVMQRGQVVVGALVAGNSLRDPEQFDPYRQTTIEDKLIIPDLQDEMLSMRVGRFTDDGQSMEKTIRLEVVGVLAQSGWRHDYTIYMPMRDVIEINTWAQGKRRDPYRQGYTSAIVRAIDVQHTMEVMEKLQDMGLSVFSDQQQVEQAEAYFATVQAVLGGIGGVALLVAAFGIANTMLMSIYERTREIGLMKAIGANHRDVMRIFLFESGCIGFMGGLGGIILGFLVNAVINIVAGIIQARQIAEGASMYTELSLTYVPLWLPIFSLLFSIVVGVFSGAYPANRAANLEPLHALKYE